MHFWIRHPIVSGLYAATLLYLLVSPYAETGADGTLKAAAYCGCIALLAFRVAISFLLYLEINHATFSRFAPRSVLTRRLKRAIQEVEDGDKAELIQHDNRTLRMERDVACIRSRELAERLAAAASRLHAYGDYSADIDLGTLEEDPGGCSVATEQPRPLISQILADRRRQMGLN